MRWTERLRAQRWLAPVLGTAVGLAYGLVSQQMDFETMKNPQAWQIADDIVSVILPTIAGALAGIIYNYMHWQRRINRTLSGQNLRAQRHLLTQMLSSHVLHEIRNPLHNLAAAVEDVYPQLPTSKAEILERNLARLQTVAEQLGQWTVLDDEIHLRDPVLLGGWLNNLISDKFRLLLDRGGIQLESHVKHVVVEMHPLLLEQCFIALLNNAIEAIGRGAGAGTIALWAGIEPTRPGYVEVRIRNAGAHYPDTVLATQGRGPVTSPHGPGLGLVLVQKSLELVGGELALANADGHAQTTLRIPGHPA